MNSIFLNKLYDNLYDRKREIINLNSLINKEIIDYNNFELSEKWKLLIKSAIISLNAHWEWYIRLLIWESIRYLYSSKELLILNENYYKMTIWSNGKVSDYIIWNNIKYDWFKSIIDWFFWRNKFIKFNMDVIEAIDKRYFIDKIEKYNIKEDFFIIRKTKKNKIIHEIKLSYIVNKLVSLRNEYWHWSIFETKLWYWYYFWLFFVIFELLEKLTEFTGNYFLNKDYISPFFKDFYEEISKIYILKMKENEKKILSFLESNTVINKKWKKIVSWIIYDSNHNKILIWDNYIEFSKEEFINILKEYKKVKFFDNKYKCLEIL